MYLTHIKNNFGFSKQNNFITPIVQSTDFEMKKKVLSQFI